MILYEYDEYDTFLINTFNEGWKSTQTGHIVHNNLYLTWQKIKRSIGLNHDFSLDKIRELNEKRLEALLNSADSKEELDSLIEQLEKWIRAAPKALRDIKSTNDKDKTKKDNRGVTADVTRLNQAYLVKAKEKLASLQKNKKSIHEDTLYIDLELFLN
jgi:Sec-independent protein translocase protein TatA